MYVQYLLRRLGMFFLGHSFLAVTVNFLIPVPHAW